MDITPTVLKCGANRRKESEKMIDYSAVQAVCFDCAKAAGFVPKEKVVGVWIDECDVCHERKPCTNLHHDWKRKGGCK